MQAIYTKHYLDNRDGSGGLTRLKNWLEGWMHERVAARQHGIRLLELGAGTLNHLRYEPPGLEYSCVEPFKDLWQGRPELGRLHSMYSDLNDVPAGRQFDRILSIAVLEHVLDLPTLIARSALMLAEDGIFQAGIPAEGGALWGLAWRMTTGVSFWLRTGLPYGEMMRHEHVNDASEIQQLLEFYFEKIDVEHFPMPHQHLSFYYSLVARRPRIDVCRATLRKLEVQNNSCLV